MKRLALLSFALATPAAAADRSMALSSFERLRIEGPFDVRLTVGRPPSARATADPQALDALDLHVEGSTLVVRARPLAITDRPRATRAVTLVTLATPRLVSANLIGGAALAIAGPLNAQRVDLSINGAGTLGADGVAADQLVVTLTGNGGMTLAGRAQRARLQTSGAGTIAAEKLLAGDLDVVVQGNGETRATARYTANVVNAGLGRVTILGTPACTVKAPGGGQVVCGR